MAQKPIVAVDIDEVLASGAPEFIAFSNQQFDTKLTIDDFEEHWSHMWQVDHDEAERRAHAWHTSGIIGHHGAIDQSRAVLERLKVNYDLVITTSRRAILEDQTRQWLDVRFGGLFSAVHFAGVFDKQLNDAAFHRTKLDLYNEIGAEYVIDDQLKHCQAAAGAGMNAVLFGNYPWNQLDTTPANLVRCNDWLAVEMYFNEQAPS